jgi:CPA2 family monovalent cation:H+ antiporter-2
MALSMGLVPLLMQKAEWIGVKINPWFSQNANPLKSLLPPAKRVKEMRDHAIICGYGPVGRRLVKRLSSLAIPSVVVEINADTVKKLAASNQPVLFADVRDQETWHLAGIERARLVVFSFPDAATTADALYHVRVLNPAVHVIVRIKYASDQTRLKALGANTVVLDEEESGRALVRETQCVFDALPPAA